MFESKPNRVPCSFPQCGRPVVARDYCSGHYKQWRKGQSLRPLRPFYGKEGPYGKNGPCRFNDRPEVQSGKWEPCTAPRHRAGWCAGHAAQHYERRPIAPLRQRRTGCAFADCPKPHHVGGYCAGHYRQLQRGRQLTPLGQRKGWYKSSAGYVYIWEPRHPNANKRGYVAEHTKVMAQILGRPLSASEEVHHRNKRRDDNRPQNLELWTRGSQPPGARASDLVMEAWRILCLYGLEGGLPSLEPSATHLWTEKPRDPDLVESHAKPPLAREITSR
jgi:hypothetical protein